MESNKFYVEGTVQVRNMVSKSCIKLIRLYFKSVNDLNIEEIRLGWIRYTFHPKKYSSKSFYDELTHLGFPVISSQNELLVEKIKLAAIELIHYAYNANSLIRNSDYISEKLSMDYQKLSKVFSEHTGTTLEKYIILLKIEKVKELLHSGEYTLSEISYMMGYSSVQYLSNQFKKISGATVSEFRKQAEHAIIPLESLLPESYTSFTK